MAVQGGPLFTTADGRANLKGKTSRPVVPFKGYDVVLLHAFDLEEEHDGLIEKGERAIMTPMPNGFLYLKQPGVGCFWTDSKEGVDFNFV